MLRRIIFMSVLLSFAYSFAQDSGLNRFLKPSDTLNQKRQKTVYITQGSLAAISLIGLNQLWYKDYDKSSFHTIDDTNEWLQMDKFGHTFSAYHLSRIGAETMAWSGADQKSQLLYGAGLGFAFLTTVEVFDGFSKEWGFSWSDIAANTLGTGLYIGQELLWKEQRIQLKYSFHQTKYADMRPSKLGENVLEQMLKDYNGQTYWLSANISSFVKSKHLPKWLNLAFGFGATGMLTGENESLDGMFPDQNRRRQYYLSLDVDLTKIQTQSHVLKALFSVINTLKVPAPTLEVNSDGKLKFHTIFY